MAPLASLSSMPWPHSWSNTPASSGVPAPAAGAVEVDRAPVPEAVAGLVDVHVGGELDVVEPVVGGQPAARHLVDLVHLVEGAAGGGGVAGPAAARGRAIVLAVAAAHGHVAGAGCADRAAGVADADVAPT